MKLVTFNPFRTIGIPNVRYIKPEQMYNQLEVIKQADYVLFPEHWQIGALVYGLRKQIFPSIEAIQLGYSKIEMTRALRVTTPDHIPYTEILGNTSANISYILETFPFPFVAKESRNSMGKGVFLIKNEEELLAYANKVDVLYIQEYLENDGKDLRVCIVGDEIISSYWRVGENGEFLHNIARGGTLNYSEIPEEALELALCTAKALNITHAGFDIIYSKNKPYILEFNTLFGNQGLVTTGVSVEQKIYQYIQSQINPPNPFAPVPPVSA